MIKLLTNIITYHCKMNHQTIPLAVYYVTAGNKEEAQKVADGLVHNQLAACVNLVEGVHSTYLWEGKVNTDKEVLLVIKSRLSLLKKIE